MGRNKSDVPKHAPYALVWTVCNILGITRGNHTYRMLLEWRSSGSIMDAARFPHHRRNIKPPRAHLNRLVHKVRDFCSAPNRNTHCKNRRGGARSAPPRGCLRRVVRFWVICFRKHKFSEPFKKRAPMRSHCFTPLEADAVSSWESTCSFTCFRLPRWCCPFPLSQALSL